MVLTILLKTTGDAKQVGVVACLFFIMLLLFISAKVFACHNY